jgi:Protein of unknown function (DUF2786)
MTRKDVISKISKLERLAAKAGTPHEAASARAAAEDLKKKHAISDRELSVGGKAAALDDLILKLRAYALRHPDMPPPVVDTIDRFRNESKEEDKAKALETIVNVARVGSLFLGRKGMGPVKDIIDETLKQHGVTI